MDAEQDPRTLFPPNIYDEVQRLAQQTHPRLVPHARDRLEAYRDQYKPNEAVDTQIAAKERRSKIWNRSFDIGSIIIGVIISINGARDKDPGEMMLGIAAAGLGVVGIKVLSKQGEEIQSYEVRRYSILQQALEELDANNYQREAN